MTQPGQFPFDLPQIDLTGFCCADQLAGGCAHSVTSHTGPNSECQGVFGCSCQGFKKHKSACVHNTDGSLGVSGDDA